MKSQNKLQICLKLKQMGLLNMLFGPSTNEISTYLSKGAIILDVRTDSEYKSKHIDNAKHIPLQVLQQRINDLKQLNKPVIAYCASGMRSGQAVSILKNNGIDAINGGGLSKLQASLP